MVQASETVSAASRHSIQPTSHNSQILLLKEFFQLSRASGVPASVRSKASAAQAAAESSDGKYKSALFTALKRLQHALHLAFTISCV